MSVARFIADQRTSYRVPHTRTCALLGVSPAWFYKWITRATGVGAPSGLFTTRDRRPDLHTFSDLRGRACGLRRRGSWARLGVVGRPE